MANVRIWSYARTQREIAATAYTADARSSTSTQQLLAWWPLATASLEVLERLLRRLGSCLFLQAPRCLNPAYKAHHHHCLLRSKLQQSCET